MEVIGDHAVFDTVLEAVERGPGQPASATRPVA